MARYNELSPAKRCIRIITIIVMFAYAVTTLVLSITAYTSLQENLTVVLNTIDNWKTGTILDIVAGPNGVCPDGYNIAYNQWWPGTTSACDCDGASDSDFRALGFSSGACNSTEISKGCVDAPSYGSVRYKSFGEISGVPQAICLQRSTETFADIGPKQGATCPSDQITCGTSLDNLFCTKEASCPVKSIQIVNADCGADCVQIDDAKWIEINRDDDVLPLVEFRLNEYGMCLDANERHENPNRDYYAFLSDTGTDCAGVGNPLWTQVDAIDEESLFSYNDITSKITTLIPFGYYPSGDGTNWNYKLFDRTYVPFKLICRGNMDNIVDNSVHFSDIKTAHLALFIVSIISFIVLGISLPILEIMNLRGVDLPCFKGEGEEERKRVLACKRIFYFFFKFLMLPFQAWAINSLTKTKDLMKYVAEDECSSDYMNKLMDGVADSLQQAFNSDVVAIVMLCISTILAVFGMIRRDKEVKSEANVAKSRNQVVNEPVNNNVQTQPINTQPQFQQQPFQQQPGFQQQPMYQQQPGFMPNQQPGYQQQPMYQQQPVYQQQPMYQQPQPQPQPQQITIQIDPGMMQQLQQQQQQMPMQNMQQPVYQ